jgi:hypothetical protein
MSCEKAIGRVKDWLRSCDNQHCCLPRWHVSSNQRPALPTRVLRVDNKDKKVYLEESQGKTGRYIALSHCWGTSKRLKTVRSNLKELKNGICTSKIPQTFRDAIDVCRSLHISYLWIDTLCIIQDDDADWEAEASRMGSVYLNSYLTISALHSVDDSQGCFPTISRQPYSMPFPFVSPDVICTKRPAVANTIPFVVPGNGTSGEDSYLRSHPFSVHGMGRRKFYITNEWMLPSTKSEPRTYATWDFMGLVSAPFDPLLTAPLSRRGWVLQERLLSPRTLHYSEGQLYWECQQCVVGEDGSILRRVFPRLEDLIASRQEAVRLASAASASAAGAEEGSTAAGSRGDCDQWLSLVEVFCTRKLTKEHDKLVALAGLARVIAEKSGDKYLAGLWKSNLLNGLCYARKTTRVVHHCDNPAHIAALPQPTAAEFTRPSRDRAPTWSWAAVDGEVAFERSTTGRMVATVVEATVTAVGSDPFGQVKAGSVRLLVSENFEKITSANSDVSA